MRLLYIYTCTCTAYFVLFFREGFALGRLIGHEVSNTCIERLFVVYLSGIISISLLQHNYNSSSPYFFVQILHGHDL